MVYVFSLKHAFEEMDSPEYSRSWNTKIFAIVARLSSNVSVQHLLYVLQIFSYR